MPVVSKATAANSSKNNVSDSIRSLHTLVQIYNFDRAGSAARATQLRKIAYDCFGTYERITNSVPNSLWTLRSYFGILARIRLTASNNRPSWTKPYHDSGSLGNIITLVFPAFADNYTLIGVTGINVVIKELGSVSQADFCHN